MASAETTKNIEAVIRVRRERVHTTMLVEVLALLIFLAMGFAFVSRDEMEISPLQQRVEELERKLAEQEKATAEAEARVRQLRLENAQLQEALRRFAGQRDGTLPADDRLVIPKQQFEALTADLANKAAIVDSVQRENARLRDRLTGRGGSDLPNCPVTPGFMFSIDISGGGSFTVRPAWSANAAGAAANVDGATQLASSQPMSQGQFRALAERVKQWGRSQNPSCVFRARVRAQHGNLGLFQSQQGIVGQYFYIQWVR